MSSSTSNSDARRFLRWFIACLLVGTTCVVCWNYAVDPYDMWHGRTRHGFNHFKSRTEGQFNRMAKAHEIRRLKPDAILLGTSRADWGLDPMHAGLQSVSTNYYNASLAGGTIYELYRYLQHAHHHQALRQVILGLDLELFNLEDQRSSFTEDRISVTADGRFTPRSLVADRVETLFTLDVLTASRKTVRDSLIYLDVRREDLRARGNPFWEEMEPEDRWDAYREGVHQARANLRHLAGQRDEIDRRMQDLDRIYAFAHAHDIELILYITPYHLSHLEVIRTSNNWDAFEAWKREIVKRNEAAVQAVGKAPFAVWDFSGYHRYATEPHPSPDDPHRIMTWYRESSHFRKITGDLLLDRILGRPGAPADFGVRIDATHLDAVLAAEREQRDAFLARRENAPGR